MGPPKGLIWADRVDEPVLYTGSDRVGKIVAKAAAETLTPTTLEVGLSGQECGGRELI